MASSIHEQVMRALDEVTKTPGVTPYRSRSRAINENKLPARILMPQNSDPQAVNYELNDNTLAVEFELRVPGNDADADPYRVALHAALMADRTLGGLVHTLDEGPVRWSFIDDGQEYCSMTMAYNVIFRTSQTDLTLDVTNEGVL